MNTKWVKKREPPNQELIRKQEEEEFKPSPSIFTKSLSKCTPTLVSQRRPWTSWTPSSMILSTELPLKAQSSSDSTREELSHPEKSNLLSSSFSPENSLDTLSLKELKPSPNTSNNDLLVSLIISSAILHFLYF